MKWWKNQKLYVKILIGVILGIVLGIIFGPSIKVIKPIGDIFIRLLQMLIIPLTFFTIISGVNKLESIKKLQSIGGKIMLIYIGTSLLSVFIGSLIALTIN
ncbi:cation:dicarboxylate symporter family transporter, partial [Staphylococcus gallinarum]|uniref:cation:dicarboxylate symporter family transporter n=3 Tax=Staphylococcus TaxID=1279 RepID=UPI000D469611